MRWITGDMFCKLWPNKLKNFNLKECLIVCRTVRTANNWNQFSFRNSLFFKNSDNIFEMFERQQNWRWLTRAELKREWEVRPQSNYGPNCFEFSFQFLSKIDCFSTPYKFWAKYSITFAKKNLLIIQIMNCSIDSERTAKPEYSESSENWI